MIDVIRKVNYEDPIGGTGGFAEVTAESMENGAILLGYHHSNSRYVVFKGDIDSLIKALQDLKELL